MAHPRRQPQVPPAPPARPKTELDGMSHPELEAISDHAELLTESIAAFSAIAILADAASEADELGYVFRRIDWDGLARLGDRMRRLSDDCLWPLITDIQDRTRDKEAGGAR
jgi:hypothetical protein